MKHLAIAVLVAVTLTAAPAVAQHKPYAGEAAREVKALSAAEIDQYRAGAGMGFAKAAELNHYPGPMHVLELADKLALSADQRAVIRQLMEAHKAEARALGVQFVESERELDALFRGGRIDEAALARAVRTAAALQGEYRLSHLETHRRMRSLLSNEQVTRYDSLRGYDSKSGHDRHKP